MEIKKSGIKKTVIGLIAIVGLIFGSYCAQLVFAKKSTENSSKSYYGFNTSLFKGTLLDLPRTINKFNLIGVDKVAFDNNSLLGQWTFVFFGFTNCGYMCPTTMAELGKTYRLLKAKKSPILPKVVMISLDPKRDNFLKLGNYVRAFDSHFYGARGKNAEINAMTKDLGIAYAKIKPEVNGKDKQDNIEHTGAIMLFNPDGKLAAFFTPPHKATDIAEDFLLLVP